LTIITAKGRIVHCVVANYLQVNLPGGETSWWRTARMANHPRGETTWTGAKCPWGQSVKVVKCPVTWNAMMSVSIGIAQHALEKLTGNTFRYCFISECKSDRIIKVGPCFD